MPSKTHHILRTFQNPGKSSLVFKNFEKVDEFQRISSVLRYTSRKSFKHNPALWEVISSFSKTFENLPVAERSLPLALTPRVPETDHVDLLSVEHVEEAGAGERHLLDGRDAVRVALDQPHVRAGFHLIGRFGLKRRRTHTSIPCLSIFLVLVHTLRRTLLPVHPWRPQIAPPVFALIPSFISQSFHQKFRRIPSTKL